MHYETAFTIIIVVALAGIDSSDEVICSCSCCTDNRCTRISRDNYTVSTCDSCQSICRTKFSATCMNRPSHVSYECTSDKQLSRQSATPDWIGVFRITGDECDTDECCCLTDVVHFTRTTNNNLRVQGEFTGQCPTTSLILDSTYPMPSESFTDLRFLDQLVSVKLSGDGRSMSFLEPDNTACRYKAVRENAASLNTINWMFVILLSSLTNARKLFI